MELVAVPLAGSCIRPTNARSSRNAGGGAPEMMARLRSRLTYANITATLALCLALTGGAYAALEIPPDSVGTKQLKKGAVARAKLKGKAVVGSKVADQSLTGRQIKSATLGRVPNAGHAGVADSATNAAVAARAGNGARRLDFQTAAVDPAPPNVFSPGAHTLLTLHELTVKASCVNVGGGNARTYVSFTSSVASSVDWSFVQFNNPGTVAEV